MSTDERDIEPGGERVLTLPGVVEAPLSNVDDASDATEELASALEAVCFALNRPLTIGEAASILERPPSQVRLAADTCASALRGRGLMLQRHNDELQLVTRPAVAWAVQRALNPERPGRLSRAATETLAIIAYRQPVTRASVEAIRGVNCETVLESLERRELIEEVGRQETPGHPLLYGTTLRFLQVVGLERVADLPPLGEGESPSLTAARFGLSADEVDDEATAAGESEPSGDGRPGTARASREPDAEDS